MVVTWIKDAIKLGWDPFDPSGGGGGTGTVSSVNSVLPDGLGNVSLTLDDIPDGLLFARPTVDEVDALAGTVGTPSAANRYVTESDSRMTNARPPTAHAVTHGPPGPGATDLLTLDESQISGLTTRLNGRQPKVGFEFPYDNTIAYNAASQTLTITPLGASWQVYMAGVPFTFVGPQQVTHAAVTGAYFIYVNSLGSLVVSTSPWDLLTTAPIAYVYYNAGSGFGLAYDERHTTDRDPALHRSLHISVGTYVYLDGGLALTGYTLTTPTDVANSWTLATGFIGDEDLKHTIPAVADGGPYTLAYRTGAAGDWLFTTGSLPFLFSAGTYINYNLFSAGVWSLATATAGTFVNWFIYLTGAVNSAYRVLVIPGQTLHPNLAAAQAETPSALQMGGLVAQEIVACYQITYRAGAGYASSGKVRTEAVTRIFSTRVQQSPNITSVHSALTGRSDPDQHPATAIAYPSVAPYPPTVTEVGAALDWIGQNIGTAIAYSKVVLGRYPVEAPDGVRTTFTLPFSHKVDDGLMLFLNGQAYDPGTYTIDITRTQFSIVAPGRIPKAKDSFIISYTREMP